MKTIAGVLGLSLCLLLTACGSSGGDTAAPIAAQASIDTNLLDPAACQIILGHMQDVANAIKGFGDRTMTADDAAKVLASARDSWSNEAAVASPKGAIWLNSMADYAAKERVALLDPSAPDPKAATTIYIAAIGQFKSFCA